MHSSIIDSNITINVFHVIFINLLNSNQRKVSSFFSVLQRRMLQKIEQFTQIHRAIKWKNQDFNTDF